LVTTFFPFFHFCEVLVDLNDPPPVGPLNEELLNDVMPPPPPLPPLQQICHSVAQYNN
jgi:hypothetical protein